MSSKGANLNYTIKISHIGSKIYLFRINYHKLKTLIVIPNHQNIILMGLVKT